MIYCPPEVIEGRLITKEKRHELHGVVAGGVDPGLPRIINEG